MPKSICFVRNLFLIAIFCFTLGQIFPSSASAVVYEDPWHKISPQVIDQVTENDCAVVMIELAAGQQDKPRNKRYVARAKIARTQNNILRQLKGDGWRERFRLRTIPFVIGEVDLDGLNRLAMNPGVVGVYPDRPVFGALGRKQVVQSVPIRLSTHWVIPARRIVVGIIDSGIDTDSSRSRSDRSWRVRFF